MRFYSIQMNKTIFFLCQRLIQNKFWRGSVIIKNIATKVICLSQIEHFITSYSACVIMSGLLELNTNEEKIYYMITYSHFFIYFSSGESIHRIQFCCHSLLSYCQRNHETRGPIKQSFYLQYGQLHVMQHSFNAKIGPGLNYIYRCGLT